MDFAVWDFGKASRGLNLAPNLRVRWVHDEDYTPDFDFGDDEANKRATEHEQALLRNGSLVALGCVIEDRTGYILDSLWGIVVEPDDSSLVDFFRHNLECPSEIEVAQARKNRAMAELGLAHEELVQAIVNDAIRQHTESAAGDGK